MQPSICSKVPDVHVKEQGKICQNYCRNTCMSFYAKKFILDESLVCSCEFQAKFLWISSKVFSHEKCIWNDFVILE